MQNIDAIVVTHTHSDHWDEVAQQFINKDIQILVQDARDFKDIKKQGFKKVTICGESIGVVFSMSGEKTSYVTGRYNLDSSNFKNFPQLQAGNFVSSQLQ